MTAIHAPAKKRWCRRGRSRTAAGATSSSIVELSSGLEVLAKVPENDLARLRADDWFDCRRLVLLK